jgi:short-subunit dehydrogenase
MKLEGKTALLTGASKGLGRDLALKLDARKCRLLLVARDTELLENLQQNLLTPGSTLYPCDLADPEGRSRLVNQLLSSESRLDLIIHNAGIGSHSRLDQLTLDEVRLVLEVNTLAPLELTAGLQTLMPLDDKAGLVFIGSVAGELAVPGMSLYSASKHALHAFGRTTAIELSGRDQFSLLVVLGALQGTQFGDAIRHPRKNQPGWYRRLDVDSEEAAGRIVQAIEEERSHLVIPRWYAPLLAFARFFAPLATPLYRRLY